MGISAFDHDDAEDEDRLPPAAVVRTAGPRAVHHLLLALSPDNPVYVHEDITSADCSAHYEAAREVWQTLPTAEGLRWRWFICPRGLIIEVAPGDIHGLFPRLPIALSVTHYTLPDRDSVGRVRLALRAAGASCATPRLV